MRNRLIFALPSRTFVSRLAMPSSIAQYHPYPAARFGWTFGTIPALCLILLLALPACEGGPESSLSPADRQLAEAYADLVLLRQSGLVRANRDTGSVYTARVDSVLRLHGLTDSSFRLEFAALPEDEERFVAVMMHAERRIREGLSGRPRF